MFRLKNHKLWLWIFLAHDSIVHRAYMLRALCAIARRPSVRLSVSYGCISQKR